MNYADTEKIRYILHSGGWREVTFNENPDLVILNTCSVRQRAEDKVLGLSHVMRSLKLKNPQVQVVLTGCMAQRLVRSGCNEHEDAKYTRSLARRLPWVDLVISIGDMTGWEVMINENTAPESAGQAQVLYDNCPQERSDRIRANVPISKGCNNFCTYCVVPFTRGREVSRSYTAIFNEVTDLVLRQYRLITLLGQNVNSWRGEKGRRLLRFPDLLDAADQIDGSYWLSFLTSHPKDFSPELVNVLADGRHISPYVNLPVQSGSDTVLARMNRKYTTRDYRKVAESLRKRVPGVRLCTDIIVGFPGETDAEFNETVSFIKNMQFGMIYLAKYSPRPGTAAFSLPDSIPEEEIERRRRIVEDVQSSIMKKLNKARVGSSVQVLMTGHGRGLTFDLTEITIEGGEDEGKGGHSGEVGSFINVVVTEGSAGGLRGRVAI